MNLLLLAIAFRAWSGSALAVFLRLMAAIAVFSVEMQIATWFQVATIRTLRLLNVVLAAAAMLWLAWRRSRTRPMEAGEPAGPDAAALPPARRRRIAHVPPLAAVALCGLVVATLAIVLPVRAADPYHLHRVDEITGRGTLAYDPSALDIKVNALAGVYELLLADLRIPGMATALVRLHGLFGLGFYLLAVAVVAGWTGVRRRWLLTVYLVVPVVFHQLVLVKNDLFGALPAFVALAWVVARGRDLRPREIAAAAALAGFAVGIKISSAPIALVVTGFIIADHRASGRAIASAVGGGAVGAVAGGLLFTLVENQLTYGGALRPYTSLGNRVEGWAEAFTGLGRFVVSLFDLGRLTPRWWPGRGGWGSTFGLPLIWAVVVLIMRRRAVMARRALIASALCFVVFGASYPDADIAHRLMLAPGLLLIAAAIAAVDEDDGAPVLMRRALVPVLVVSALQIARSAMLYLLQAG